MSEPQSLPDAMIQLLRANSPVTTAFGDTYNASLTIAANAAAGNVCSLWSDYDPQSNEPYLVFEEVGERYDFMTRTAGLEIANFTSSGTAICRVYHSSRATARALGILVCNVLNDCDFSGVTWPGFGSPEIFCQLDELRMTLAQFVPAPQVGPSTPTQFQRVISFEYMYQGQISEP